MYVTQPLLSRHRKNAFSCGKTPLDIYLKQYASQDIKRKLAVCFVLADREDEVLGYYTLSNASVPRSLLPEKIQKRVPPGYHDLPTTLLGRLAITQSAAGQGLGELLLLDALKRSYDVSMHSIASMAVIVDPIDKQSSRFYEKYGFITLQDSGKQFLPMKTIGKLFSNQS